MMLHPMKKIPLLANILIALGIASVLIGASVFEFVLNEAPCPLCFLQRLGFLLSGTGLLLNLRYGENFSHYTIILLSMAFTAMVSLRQIVLHILPGNTGFGSSIFGLHLYTWSFIIIGIVGIMTIISLAFENKNLIGKQYFQEKTKRKEKLLKNFIIFLFVLFFLLALVNCIDALRICGLLACPENP